MAASTNRYTNLLAVPSDISIEYFQDADLTKRAKERGYNFFTNGYVHGLKLVKTSTETMIDVGAKCYRSMRKSETPHSISLTIDTEERNITERHCSCKAGVTGTCSHSTAVIYQLSHYKNLGMTDVPSELACTSMPQQWHKPRGQKIEPEPVTAMIFAKPNPTPRKKRPVHSSPLNFRIPDITSENIKQFKVNPASKGTPLEYLLHFDDLQMTQTNLGNVQLGSMLPFQAVYITATMPYVLLLVLMVRAATLPGAKDGVLYYITPSFSQITNFQVWSEAAVQVFFSTCVSWGPLITMASHNKFRNNCLRDSIFLVIAGELTSVLVGFVVFSILGYMAHMSKLPIEDVVKSGPGLVFIAYPEAVSTLPLPNLWAILFFLMVLMLGLDTQFGTVEPVIAIFTESFVFIRRNRVKFTAFVVVVCFLFGLPFCFQGGVYLFQLMDWYAGAGVPLFGLIECLVFGWIYGAENFSRDIESMLGRPVPVVIRILWCCITPVLLMALLFIILTNYQLPTYGNYSYPKVANVFGVITAIIPVLPIPIVAILELRKAKGDSLMEKFQSSIRPSEKWGPVDHYTRTCYERKDYEVKRSFVQTIKINLIGKYNTATFASSTVQK